MELHKLVVLLPMILQAPVDYIVSNGKQNVKYTITVAKSSNMAWVRMPDFTATSVFSGSVLKINPVDQVPYLGFKLKRRRENGCHKNLLMVQLGQQLVL